AGSGGFLLSGPHRLRIGTWTSAGLRLTDLERGEHKTLPLGPERKHLVGAAETHRGLRIVAWVGNTTFELLDEAGKVVCRVDIREGKERRPFVVSPDGTRLASCWGVGEGLRFVVFYAKTGKRTAVCAGHRDDIWAFTLSPDGTRLASASEDRMARLW